MWKPFPRTNALAYFVLASVSDATKSFTTLTNAMFCSWNLSSATANFSKAANLSLYFIALSRYLILTFSVFFLNILTLSHFLSHSYREPRYFSFSLSLCQSLSRTDSFSLSHFLKNHSLTISFLSHRQKKRNQLKGFSDKHKCAQTGAQTLSITTLRLTTPSILT